MEVDKIEVKRNIRRCAALLATAALFAGSVYALEINDVYDVNVASGASQTISEAITGSGSIRKTGAGTLARRARGRLS